MSKEDDKKEEGKSTNISISGDVSGQLGLGDNVVQIGNVGGGKVVFGPEKAEAGGRESDEPEPRTSVERERLAELRRTLSARYSESELQDLVFDLGLDYESLPGDGKAGKARELVAHCDRHGLIADLVEAMKKGRPDVFE
jgi:hypothetical protein